MNDHDGFDLVEQPWLLAHDLRGRHRKLSLVDVVRDAGDLAGLAGDVPTQTFALTRLVLAVLHRALADQLDAACWESWWRGRSLPVEAVERYLAAHRQRFDLFHPETPFFQVAGLRTAKNEVSELSKLIVDVPNGYPFFTNRLTPQLTLSYAEAARWLVHCQAFDPSGIKSGAADDPRTKNGKGYPIGTGWSGTLGGVLPEGASLVETLLLNLIPNPAPGDLPAWERQPSKPGTERTPGGPVDLFTWQSRRIRLAHGDGRVTGVLICNGDRLAPQNKHGVEAHTAWRRSLNQEKKLKSATPVYMPLTHDPDRLVWRGLQAMLPSAVRGQGSAAAPRLTPGVLEWISRLTNNRTIPRTYPLRLHVFGMQYGSNESVVGDIVDDAMSLQAVLLDQGAEDLKQTALAAVTAAEDSAAALGKLAANLAEAGGAREPAGHRSRASEAAYAALDPVFRTWLAQLGPYSDPTEAQVAWHTSAQAAIGALGRDLIDRCAPQAWSGRLVRNRWVTAAHADLRFRRDLNLAFPLAERAPVKDIV